MQSLNLELLRWMAAGPDPTPWVLLIARAFAQGGAVVCGLITLWAVWRRPGHRSFVTAAWLMAGVASLLSHAIAKRLGMPRPFVLELTPVYIAHGASASLPSTHACVMATVALIFLCRPALRPVGAALLALAAATGWARTYVGVHSPLDIVAGFALAAVLTGAFVAAQRLLRRTRAGADRRTPAPSNWEQS